MSLFTPADLVGFGLQGLGGIIGQYTTNKQLAFEKKKYEDEKKQLALQNMINARQWQDQQAQQTRQQNFAGLNYLSNLRNENQQLARQRSFRDNILKAGV